MASKSFLTAAARLVAFATEVINCSISMGVPLSSFSSDLEKSERSCGNHLAPPFRYKRCNWTLIRMTSAA